MSSARRSGAVRGALRVSVCAQVAYLEELRKRRWLRRRPEPDTAEPETVVVPFVEQPTADQIDDPKLAGLIVDGRRIAEEPQGRNTTLGAFEPMRLFAGDTAIARLASYRARARSSAKSRTWRD